LMLCTIVAVFKVDYNADYFRCDATESSIDWASQECQTVSLTYDYHAEFDKWFGIMVASGVLALASMGVLLSYGLISIKHSKGYRQNLRFFVITTIFMFIISRLLYELSYEIAPNRYTDRTNFMTITLWACIISIALWIVAIATYTTYMIINKQETVNEN
jgi:hypothetical protein